MDIHDQNFNTLKNDYEIQGVGQVKSLKDILFLPPVDNALVTLGKIVVALYAFLGVLRGVISIGEGLFYAYNGTLPQAILAYAIIGGLISAITGYAYYLLLDMENKGRLVSYGRFVLG